MPRPDPRPDMVERVREAAVQALLPFLHGQPMPSCTRVRRAVGRAAPGSTRIEREIGSGRVLALVFASRWIRGIDHPDR